MGAQGLVMTSETEEAKEGGTDTEYSKRGGHRPLSLFTPESMLKFAFSIA
jgi:hypothetical protein